MSNITQTEAKRCTKCGGDDLLFVEAVRGSWGSGNVIPLSGLFIAFHSIKVDRSVCMACGFCEEWITNPEDRESLRRWYGPGTRRSRINDRWRRWCQWWTDFKSRIVGPGVSVTEPHDGVQS